MHLFDWKHYDELSKTELHEIFILRQEVFVVEQKCPYLDADNLDIHSYHLMAQNKENQENPIAAYLRVIEPGRQHRDCRIGRVLTRQSSRGKGLGKQLMKVAIDRIKIQYPSVNIKISAQLHLENFYKSLGFSVTSEPYDEDGIPHIEMFKQM